MRKALSILSVTLLSAASAAAETSAPASATTRSFERARGVLLVAADAHGGLEKLRAIKTVHRTGKGKTLTQGQGMGPDSPPIIRDLETDSWLDFQGTRARSENRLAKVGGLTIHTRNVLTGDSGYGWNGLTNASTRSTPTGLTGLRNQVRRDPLRVIVSALARSETARSLGTDTFDGRGHDVVAFADAEGALVTLYFDSQTHLLSKLETFSDTAVLGDTLNEQIYSDYRTVEGVKVPFRLLSRNAGQVTQDLTFSAVQLDAAPPPGAFDLPGDVLEQSSAATTPVLITPLGTGIYLIGGGTHYTLAVEFRDHVVVVDAPLSAERTRTVLDKVKELSAKPVRSVVATHYHFDHTGGLREYIAEGTNVITHAANAGFVKGLATRPRMIRPDRLSAKPATASVQTVTDKLVLSDGNQTLELHAMPNTHVEGMLVAYLPKEKLLYNADLFGPPLVGPLPVANDFAIELRDGIKKLNLQVEKFAGAHGRTATAADLEESIRLRQKQTPGT
jgi:glyoxylase-like metal-dependent hydrolase (beta-lactamase superfamily II)